MSILKSKRTLILAFVLASTCTFVLWPYIDCYGQMHLNLAEKISLDGYSTSLVDCGSGDSPTIIIEGGINQTKRNYYGLQKKLMRHARVITYDHAGIGQSSVSGNPRTLPNYVKELESVIAAKNLEPPFVLIGHSLGGHIIRYYTHVNPDDVAGLVFLDHAHEDWFKYIRENWSDKEQERYFNFFNPEITSEDQVTLLERASYEQNQDLIRGKVIPANIPVLMFTGIDEKHQSRDGTRDSQDNYAWTSMQLSLISHSENAKQIVDWDTGHYPHIDKPKQVSQEINSLIKKIRDSYKQ